MMSHRDAAELEKFLSCTAFDRSPMGGILAKCEMFAVKHRRQGELTARITAEVRETPKQEPDLYLLEVFGRASRRIKRVAEVDPTSAAALVALYGDSGAKWGRGKYGRVGALLHLTEAGRRLARKAANKERGAKLELTEVQRMENAVAQQELQPLPQRETLLQQALGQAWALKERAEAAYAETGRVAS